MNKRTPVCTCFDDVRSMHIDKRLPHEDQATLLDHDHMDFRVEFMQEELNEIKSSFKDDDLSGVADGLIDLAYVVLGTGVCMGLPWGNLWREVHRANMQKQRGKNASRATSTHAVDLIKPPTWRPPDIDKVLRRQR